MTRDEPLFDPHREQEEAESRRAELDRLQAAMGRLNEGDQEMLRLRQLEGLSNQDAATVLGISEQAASMQYLRAKKRLRELMDREFDRAKSRDR